MAVDIKFQRNVVAEDCDDSHTNRICDVGCFCNCKKIYGEGAPRKVPGLQTALVQNVFCSGVVRDLSEKLIYDEMYSFAAEKGLPKVTS